MRRSDADADLSLLIEPLAPRLLAYFIRRVDEREDAADCVSETLVILWRRRKSLPKSTDEANAWAFGVARRVLGNYRRGRVRRTALGERLRSELREHAQSEAETDVHEALARLTADDRELVMLIAWDGFGVGQAGALLGLKPEAARARYSRARKVLREHLT